MKTNNQPKEPRERARSSQLSPSPGAHPVAVGAGAAAAGFVGTIAGASLGGPVGAAVGAAAGAFAGGLIGKGIGEVVDPTEEDAYWAEHHGSQPYAEQSLFETFKEAYRAGYQGAGRHAPGGKSYEDVEDELRMEYEGGGAAVPWKEAQPAVRAAWDRAYQRYSNRQTSLPEDR